MHFTTAGNGVTAFFQRLHFWASVPLPKTYQLSYPLRRLTKCAPKQ